MVVVVVVMVAWYTSKLKYLDNIVVVEISSGMKLVLSFLESVAKVIIKRYRKHGF